MHPARYRHDHLDEVLREIAEVGERERALTADLTRERAQLEDLLERRWGLLSDELQARVEQAPPATPGLLHSRRDALVMALVVVTGTGTWALVGAVVVLVLRAA